MLLRASQKAVRKKSGRRAGVKADAAGLRPRKTRFGRWPARVVLGINPLLVEGEAGGLRRAASGLPLFPADESASVPATRKGGHRASRRFLLDINDFVNRAESFTAL